MKIKKVIIDNIRCFKHLEIDLTNNKGVVDWLVILGDNGVGKSTILRSIALGLTEESGASGLLDELVGDWIRIDAPDNKGYVSLELEPFVGCTEKAIIKTDFAIDNFKEVKVRQTVTPVDPETFKWDNLFVCGYGTNRSAFAAEEYNEYTVTDAIYPQFKYSHKLQSPELIVRRLQSLGIKNREIFSKLEYIMMLEQGSISMEFSGIKVSGPWGEKMSYGALSDGYRVVLSMFTDTFGWKGLVEGSLKKPNKINVLNMEGIIIIDELEQHLHPRWQKEIISLLHNQFPKVQFIVSTHSPLCVVGTTELKDEDCIIVSLDREEDDIKCNITSPPRGKRADQVLTSYLFDLNTTSDNKIKNDIEKYNLLYIKEIKTEDEVNELNILAKNLNETLGSAETELEQKVGKLLKKALDTLFEEETKTKKNSPEKFELIRQLQDLLK